MVIINKLDHNYKLQYMVAIFFKALICSDASRIELGLTLNLASPLHKSKTQFSQIGIHFKTSQDTGHSWVLAELKGQATKQTGGPTLAESLNRSGMQVLAASHLQ